MVQSRKQPSTEPRRAVLVRRRECIIVPANRSTTLCRELVDHRGAALRRAPARSCAAARSCAPADHEVATRQLMAAREPARLADLHPDGHCISEITRGPCLSCVPAHAIIGFVSSPGRGFRNMHRNAERDRHVSAAGIGGWRAAEVDLRGVRGACGRQDVWHVRCNAARRRSSRSMYSIAMTIVGKMYAEKPRGLPRRGQA